MLYFVRGIRFSPSFLGSQDLLGKHETCTTKYMQKVVCGCALNEYYQKGRLLDGKGTAGHNGLELGRVFREEMGFDLGL